MTDWFDAESKMTAEVINEFGRGSEKTPRRHTIIPMAKPARGRSVEDAVRCRFEFEGVFDWPWDRAILHQEDAMESTRAPTMMVHRGCMRYKPIVGDRMLVKHQGETLQFEIIDVRRDGESAILFDLSQLGLQT